MRTILTFRRGFGDLDAVEGALSLEKETRPLLQNIPTQWTTTDDKDSLTFCLVAQKITGDCC